MIAAATRRGHAQQEGRSRPERVHRPGEQRDERRLVRVAERRVRAGDDEVQLVAVEAVPCARRGQERELRERDQCNPARRTSGPAGVGCRVRHSMRDYVVMSAQAAMREERRVVTALAADLVGSTALGERLDPEEVRLLIGDAVARMVHAVEGFGGTVKDLAGDGVLALFGAPTAHEDDPERALRAALQLADELRTYAGEVEKSFGIAGFGARVGVDTGTVVVGPVGAGSRVEYGAVGDAVNVASRLQGQAPPGSVLAGAETVRLVEGLFSFGEPRTLELKGKADPVLAYEVLRAVGAPRPDDDALLVGRTAEIARARAAVELVTSGSGGILLIGGEAGIGKSRLLAELRRIADTAAAERPALWLEGRCVSYGESMPYWPFRELLRDWLGCRWTIRSCARGCSSGAPSTAWPASGPASCIPTSAASSV